MVIGTAQIDQWYMNQHTGEMFFVTGYDQKAKTIEIQSIEGDVSEIDEETWAGLPLAPAEEPQMSAEDTDNDTRDEAYPDDVNTPIAKIAAGEREID